MNKTPNDLTWAVHYTVQRVLAARAVSLPCLCFLSLDTNSLGANNHFLGCQVPDPLSASHWSWGIMVPSHWPGLVTPPVSPILQQLFASPRHSQQFCLRLLSIIICLFVHNLHNWQISLGVSYKYIPCKNLGQWTIKKLTTYKNNKNNVSLLTK